MLFLELLLLFVVCGDVKCNPLAHEVSEYVFEPTITVIHTEEIEVTQEDLEEIKKISDNRTHRIIVATKFMDIVEREAEASPLDEVEGEYVVSQEKLPEEK